jgi:hypothetical protein
MFAKRLVKLVAAPAVICSCLVGITFLQLLKINDLANQAGTSQTYLKQEEFEKIRLTLFKRIPSLGFSNLIADWSFLEFLQYFGDDSARKATGYSLAPDYFEAIVAHDPRFTQAYFYLSPATSLYAGRPDLSVELIRQGLKSVSPDTSPNSYYLWLYKGTDEMLFLGKIVAAQHSFEMAAKWASVYNNPAAKQVAISAQQTAQFLAHNPSSKRAQVSAWMMILGNAIDDHTRQLAIEHIKALGGQVKITLQMGIKEVRVQLPKED